MLGDHFYNETTRKIIAVFGRLFNDLYVHKVDSSGNVLKRIRVPLSYGPKQKFLARLDQQENVDENQVAIKLPRMAFEIMGFTPDPNTKTNKYNRVVTDGTTTSTRGTRYTYAPWRIAIDLYVLGKNEDDVLQIFEQIVPYFQPDYNVTIKGLKDQLAVKDDVMITLQGVSPAEEYEGDFLSRRALIYTLSFEVKVRYYGPLSDQGVIQTAIVDFNDFDTEELLERLTVTESGTVIS